MFSRVTDFMVSNTFMSDAQRNLKTTTDLQHQISTGQKVDTPADDPIGASHILDYTQTLSQLTQYTNTVDDATSTASNIDTVMSDMTDSLLRVRDLAVSASNEAPSDQQSLNAQGQEIDSLMNQMVDEANQKFNGNYLFSGLKTSTVPFVAKNYLEFVAGTAAAPANGATPIPDGTTLAAGTSVTLNMPSSTINGVTTQSQAITDPNSVQSVVILDGNGNIKATLNSAQYTADQVNNQVTIANLPVTLASTDKIQVNFNKVVSVEYQGDSDTNQVEISNGTRVPVSYAGAVSNDSTQMSVFGKFSSSGNETASVEAFQKLINLRDNIYKYSNVPGGNLPNISQGITDVDSVRNNITNVQAEQGGRVNRLTLAKNRLSSMTINTTQLRSNYLDVDMTQAITSLTLAQNTYQACLDVGSKVLTTSLLNYLSTTA